MNKNKKAFTLVELVIVAVILSILATVWFISYEDYLADTRDSKRLSQLAGLRDSLRLSITKWALPIPDDSVEIRNNGTTFLYQWYAGNNVLEGISYSENTADPFDDVPYTYLLSRNKKDFQLLWFLEKFNVDVISSLSNDAYAAVDYSQRYPNVFWKKLWILLEQQTNAPLQEIPAYTASGYMDLQDTTTTEFDAYITDTYLISWKESDLLWIIPFTTCKKILETGWSYWNGPYNVNPTGLNPFTVYCDMTVDNGWWTLVGRSHELWNNFNFWWLTNKWSIFDDSSEYSLWSDSVDLNFSEMLIASYSTWKNIKNAIRVNVNRSYIKSSDNYGDWSETTWCEEVYPNDGSTWISPCDGTAEGKASDLNGVRYWWYAYFSDASFAPNTTNDSHFMLNPYFANSVGTTNNWLRSNGLHNARTEVLWDLQWEQGMIFVR